MKTKKVIKEYDKTKQNFGLQLFEISEIIQNQKNWIDLAHCYCENNPDNETSPCKIILALENIIQSNEKLFNLNEKIIEDFHKII